MLKGNLLIVHGGGPTPVINASLRGVLEEAKKYPNVIDASYGARFGAEGLLSGELCDLSVWSPGEVALLSDTPASAIGSYRRKINDDDYEAIFNCLKRNNIRYFFLNGGNGSMHICDNISRYAQEIGYEMRMIGIPKTIDNDLALTDHSPGFGSAARYAATAAAELAMDAASLPIHVVVMELMGRDAGWITAAASLFRASMPCELLVYLPEMPLTREKFLSDVREHYSKKRGLLVCVSEGVRDESGKLYGENGIRDGFGHIILGGAAQSLTNLILQETDLKSRSEKPGLLGRVSMAYKSMVDHDEAYAAGSFAVRSAVEGHSGCMAAIEADRSDGYRSEMKLVPLEKVIKAGKNFPKEWILSSGNGISSKFDEYCLPLIGASAPAYTNIFSQSAHAEKDLKK